ncbi:MAG: topoisomerase DNA-binding C4 zinc finger domain-containing protein [Gammaproteobacteria bacterium]|nr:topoisomerase DNA-binding C4 zinc finger domain-containing protein [Gammaproteobacteria bacterium]
MIIKNKDDSQARIDYLSDLLERDFPDEKKRLVDRELKNLYSGKKGEETSAYYLDFDFKQKKNWVLIHDLRLEHDGDVAQIDHLLIGRMLDIYVIESKNFNYGVSISDEGDFSYFYENRPYSIPSPIAQNERHIRLLERLLNDNGLLPTRLGITLRPNYRNIVLISPQSRLTKPKKGLYDCSAVMKADKFLERFNNDINDDSLSSVMSLAKVISQQSLYTFANKLVLMHKPITINYMAKFWLEESDVVVAEPDTGYTTGMPKCPKCGKEMIRRSAKKGKNPGKEFFGCSDFPKCRGAVAAVSDSKPDKSESNPVDESVPDCPKCGASMVKRITKKGENNQKEFWGCNKFPKCRGTISIS